MSTSEVPTRVAIHRPAASPAPLPAAAVGIVPIVWNNADLPAAAPFVPASEVLDEIERLGYEGTQLGIGFPRGKELARELAARHLRLAEVYASIPCGRDGPTSGGLRVGRDRLAELHAAGGEVLVIALERSAERDPWAGRAAGAPGLAEGGWTSLGDLLNTLGEDAARLGHRIAFHNHVATYVETPDELDRLVDAADPGLVGLCLDVGHAIVGGGDPVELLDRYGDRVIHVHLKDVAPGPLAALQAGELDGFLPALQARLFTPLGGGVLALPAVLSALAARGYEGWLMVEQDTTWEPPSEAAAVGRRVLDATLRWAVAPQRLELA
ncbi:MAG: sugar phosphate isomerase/epimerase [Chloroflexota bacterium]|nr:sugar phosphate isomerase/epimerase [Chloroflexota bacterium]